MRKTVDKVCAGAAGKAKLTLKALPEDKSYVLIEGDKSTFEFLRDLFASHAVGDDCGFQIAPNGPGKALFKKGSEYGLYLHRLPCAEKKVSKLR